MQAVGPTDEIREGEVVVRDDTLDLVELGEVGRVDGFVPENAVDTEQLRGLEPSGLVRDLVQHRCRHRGRVRAQDEARGLLLGERVPVASRAKATLLVHLLDALVVVWRERRRLDGVWIVRRVSESHDYIEEKSAPLR